MIYICNSVVSIDKVYIKNKKKAFVLVCFCTNKIKALRSDEKEGGVHILSYVFREVTSAPVVHSLKMQCPILVFTSLNEILSLTEMYVLYMLYDFVLLTCMQF